MVLWDVTKLSELSAASFFRVAFVCTKLPDYTALRFRRSHVQTATSAVACTGTCMLQYNSTCLAIFLPNPSLSQAQFGPLLPEL